MEKTVERWGMLELEAHGPKEGNPFTERQLTAVFRGKNEEVRVSGFYDGEGVYKVRFMPSFEGEYTYETSGNFPGAQTAGSFLVTPAS